MYDTDSIVELLDAGKEFMNQGIINISPESIHPFLNSVLPQHWQEWLLPLMGIPFIMLFILEWMYQKYNGKSEGFSLRRSITNFNLGGIYITFELVIQALVVLPLCLWLYQFRFFTIEVTWFSPIPIFIALEFLYYWFHRASHRINWFWSAHIVHHTDDRMNLSTAMRQSLLYSITGWWLFFTPLMFLGVHPVWVFFFYALDLIYQFFIHTETVRKLPKWIEYWFNTPSNHRAHHGTNASYIDKNYGGVLIIFDRWFGTYVEEDAENNPVRYGAYGEKSTDSILQIIFSFFSKMWSTAFRRKGLRNKLNAFIQPPSKLK